MERYNIFNQVHKGLRAFLYETAMAVQQTDFAIDEEARLALERINEALYFFSQHDLQIEYFLFPFVAEYNPNLIAGFKQQFQSNAVQIQRMRGVMNAYHHALSTAEKKAAGKPILKTFTAFLVSNVDGLAREDNLLNGLLWRYYNDEELLGLEKAIVAKLPPKDLAALSKWIIRGTNNTEIIDWLKAIEKTSITPVFTSFFKSAERELPEGRWQKIQEALAEGNSV